MITKIDFSELWRNNLSYIIADKFGLEIRYAPFLPDRPILIFVFNTRTFESVFRNLRRAVAVGTRTEISKNLTLKQWFHLKTNKRRWFLGIYDN